MIIRRLIVCCSLLVALVSCSNRADLSVPATSTPSPDSSEATTTQPPQPDAVMFGDIASPCGPAIDGVTPSIAAEENGGSAEAIAIATGSDKGNSFISGLNGELFDAAIAFEGWCNAQGGIAGLPLKVIDADAKLFEVPIQIENVCANAFAMVGGGWAFDDQEFPRFHECGMIDVAGFVVTAAKSQADNTFSPLPNPSNLKDQGWFKWAVAQHPEAMQHFATVYSDILTSQIVQEQYLEGAEIIGGVTVVDQVPYNSVGETSWLPIAQRLKNSGVRAMSLVGVPEVLPQLTKALKELNYPLDLIMVDAGFYADVLITRGGSSVEGVVVRTGYALFEEADRVPAVRDYLEMMETYQPSGKVSGLGMQSLSAFLLFSTAAKNCVVNNVGLLTRSCIAQEISKISEWTGGGLHPPSNPGTNQPSPCYQMIVVKNGKFSRMYPPLEPTAADRALIPTVEITEDGWACDESTLVPLVGDYGDVSVGKIPK
ncbi:MAG: hypothetical protein EXQ66_02900 [Ilumatobacteraceae bacterium]|nr:hypothetical protein [Ilumatobacteraceae bacterium]